MRRFSTFFSIRYRQLTCGVFDVAYPSTDNNGRFDKRSETDTSTLPGDEHLDVHAFDHPATYESQRTVWIPIDAAGLWQGEYDDSRAAGVSFFCIRFDVDVCEMELTFCSRFFPGRYFY